MNKMSRKPTNQILSDSQRKRDGRNCWMKESDQAL